MMTKDIISSEEICSGNMEYMNILNNVYTVSRASCFFCWCFLWVPPPRSLAKSEAPNYIIDLCCEQLKADGRALATKFSRSQALMDRYIDMDI